MPTTTRLERGHLDDGLSAGKMKNCPIGATFIEMISESERTVLSGYRSGGIADCGLPARNPLRS